MLRKTVFGVRKGVIVVCVLTIMSANGYAQNAGDVVVGKPSKEDKPAKAEKLEKRMKAEGGQVVVDGSLRVNEFIIPKYIELVETSTPTTPTSNHVKIWLNQDVGTNKQSLRIQYEDGTVKVLSQN